MPRRATAQRTPARVRRRSFARTWSRRLVRERALPQQARRIALDALTQPCDVVRCRAEIADHLIDATQERVGAVGELREATHRVLKARIVDGREHASRWDDSGEARAWIEMHIRRTEKTNLRDRGLGVGANRRVVLDAEGNDDARRIGGVDVHARDGPDGETAVAHFIALVEARDALEYAAVLGASAENPWKAPGHEPG